ncbi:MAG: LptF/LptG family permease, partial [Saprospiraceae bacterium]|nr:LptF/LptG family permease [Saprospiraceae bacterium]
RFSVTTATKGEMYGSDDDRYFVMKLYNGGRSEEGNKNPNDKSYPFVRLKFKKWTKVFDLSQFDLNRTDENLFKNNQAMMKSSELVVAIDSINSEISDRVTRASGIVNEFWKRSNLKLIENNSDKIPTDTLKSMIASNKVNTEVTKNTKDSLKIKENIKNFFKDRKKNSILNIPSSVNPSTQDRISDMFSGSAKQILTQPIEKYHSLLETFSKHDQEIVLGNAINQIHNVETQTEIMQQSIAKIIESKAKHVFQLMGKFTFALACLIFLFIGAPMGAIVRKGGFGYPILVAIIFFMLFVTLNILFQRLAEKNVLNPYLAAAMPSILLICVGAFLTTKAMNDSQLSININIQEKWEKITTLFKKIKKANA